MHLFKIDSYWIIGSKLNKLLRSFRTDQTVVLFLHDVLKDFKGFVTFIVKSSFWQVQVGVKIDQTETKYK